MTEEKNVWNQRFEEESTQEKERERETTHSREEDLKDVLSRLFFVNKRDEEVETSLVMNDLRPSSRETLE